MTKFKSKTWYLDGWGYTYGGVTVTGSYGSYDSGSYGGTEPYSGQEIGDCVIQSVAYMYGLSVDVVHAQMSEVLQELYGFSATASDIMAGNSAYVADAQALMTKVTGNCNVPSYNTDASICALGLTNYGHALVLEFYDASTNSYQYVDPQNNNITGTIAAEDLNWVITGDN
ncbi:MAG: hypothetical protein VB024_06600 [Dysgonamonadaceae bacterium]|nr:hypothetical protein [Dysgonamonadaceae bacterium]